MRRLKTDGFWFTIVCKGVSQYMARTTTLTPEERAEKRRAYQREYARKNREKKTEAHRKWVKNNPDKVKESGRKNQAKYITNTVKQRVVLLSRTNDSELINFLENKPKANEWCVQAMREKLQREK